MLHRMPSLACYYIICFVTNAIYYILVEIVNKLQLRKTRDTLNYSYADPIICNYLCSAYVLLLQTASSIVQKAFILSLQLIWLESKAHKYFIKV